jgi:hypothetical protein
VSGSIRYSFHSDAKALFFRKWGKIIKNDWIDILSYSLNNFKRTKRIGGKKYLAVNLSNSLFYQDYFDLIIPNLEIDLIQTYNLPIYNRDISDIRLEDVLTWETCRLNIPILYLVDNFTSLLNNYFWFNNRLNKNDIVIDRNCNIFFTKELLSLSNE